MSFDEKDIGVEEGEQWDHWDESGGEGDKEASKDVASHISVE